MSDQTSIFNSPSPSPAGDEPTGGSNPPNAVPDNQLKTILEGIRNDKGEPKYKTIEDAVVALKHSQEYIPQLTEKLRSQEVELANAKAAAAKVAELERTLESLTQSKQSPAQTTPVPAGLSKEEIAGLITSTLEQQRQQAAASENQSQVINALTTAFGTKAEEVFYAKAKDLGLTVGAINSLAAQSPKVVLQLLGIESSKGASQSPNSGAINTTGIQPTQGSFIGKNTKPTLIGATTSDLHAESLNSRKMVEELHKQGLSVSSLTDPKVYFKQFK